jgi:hypothetical protein
LVKLTSLMSLMFVFYMGKTPMLHTAETAVLLFNAVLSPR